eukprot:CAMPEP_0185523744 /NCGR_PEP_ID=MMETSP1366-20130426/86176_1 /TAXON_ID=38817 /ORGANISM="Gephyrocapsa oceanica, Strain RCC1303" /LENGTH=298 /DNA_ID=CAMNT_0028135059 /DNA_START=63 /DNA_END=954 /DNA_ORIENTATION=-
MMAVLPTASPAAASSGRRADGSASTARSVTLSATISPWSQMRVGTEGSDWIAASERPLAQRLGEGGGRGEPICRTAASERSHTGDSGTAAATSSSMRAGGAGEAEHAPPPLWVVRERVVDEQSEQAAGGEQELVGGGERATQGRGRHLGEVDWAEDAGQPGAHAGHEAAEEEDVEAGSHHHQCRAQGKRKAGEREAVAAAVRVSDKPAQRPAEHGSDDVDRHDRRLLVQREPERFRDLRHRARDDTESIPIDGRARHRCGAAEDAFASRGLVAVRHALLVCEILLCGGGVGHACTVAA